MLKLHWKQALTAAAAAIIAGGYCSMWESATSGHDLAHVSIIIAAVALGWLLTSNTQ